MLLLEAFTRLGSEGFKEAWTPGMVAKDVGGINEKSLISCFFRVKI